MFSSMLQTLELRLFDTMFLLKLIVAALLAAMLFAIGTLALNVIIKRNILIFLQQNTKFSHIKANFPFIQTRAHPL